MKKIKYLLLAVSTLFLIQCGKPGEEENFEVTLPSSEVLMHDVARTVNGKQLQPNWLELTFTIKNGMGSSVRIEDVSVYVTVDGKEAGPFSFDPGSVSYTDPDDGTRFEYGFCTYPGGSTTAYQFGVCLNGNSDPSKAFPLAGPVIYYVDGIPKPADGNAPLAFTGRIVLKGVTIKDGSDSERFEKTVYINTK